MLIQYQILNMCLFQLHRSRLSTVSKLKLEVQLYHLKRLLLMDEVAAIVKDNASSEKEFMSLYEGFKNLLTDDSTATDIEGLLVKQSELNQAISRHGVQCWEPFLEMIGDKNTPFATSLGARLARCSAEESGGSGEEEL
jgi:hypothetical protein